MASPPVPRPSQARLLRDQLTFWLHRSKPFVGSLTEKSPEGRGRPRR